MLVPPQQAATVCELDLVLHTIGSSKRAQTLDPNQRPENSHEPLNLTLDLEYAHVRGHFLHEAAIWRSADFSVIAGKTRDRALGSPKRGGLLTPEIALRTSHHLE